MSNLGKRHLAIFGIKYFPSRGGTSRVVESLLRHLKDDYIITIYCYAHPRAATNIPDIRIITFPEPKIKNIGVFIYFTKCLFHLLFKGKYDLVHVHKTEAAFFIPCIRLRFPVIATSHEIPYKNNKWSWFGKLYFHAAEWLFMHSGATLTSISKTQCEYYEAKYKKPVQYIPNGIEQPKLADEKIVTDFLDNHHIEGDYIFFAARRIIPLKGCHHLIDALIKMDYRGQVIVAGDTRQMPQYTSQLLHKANYLKIKFVGYIDSPQLLNSLAKRSKLFVFPSEIEGMSMMLLEVATLGTPIVCSDIPQNKVILDDSHVLYFKSQDVDDLANKITWALKNYDLMMQRSASAGDFILRKYGIQQIVSVYRDLYDRHLTSSTYHEFTKL